MNLGTNFSETLIKTQHIQKKNELENIIHIMAAILFKPQCAKVEYISIFYWYSDIKTWWSLQ